MDLLRRILLLTDMSFTFGRGATDGVIRYAHPVRPWSFTWMQPEAVTGEHLRRLRPDGVIGLILSPDVLWYLRRMRIPTVNLANLSHRVRLPAVFVDDDACGEMAAGHFQERGLRHFGFYGHSVYLYSRRREAGFCRAVRRAGFRPHVLRRPGEKASLAVIPLGMDLHDALLAWLAALPKPAGVYGAADHFALEVMQACRVLNLRVPEDIAVLGTHNDDLIVHLAHPPMSSIATPAQAIGYRAAELLDRLMRADPPPTTPILLPPQHVVMRQSSDTLGIEDSDVARALACIRLRACEPLDVPALLRELPLSRRVLERKFRRHLGRSPLQEIRRVRTERIKTLLAGTDLTMSTVARETGFARPQRMAILFRQETGLTPMEYRRQFQARMHRLGP